MSLNPDIRDRAYQFFIEEAQELLQVLEDGLLNLKEDRSTSKIHELMRAAHSIKGGAASVELETIKLIAHRLEDFFKALYSEKVEFDDRLESLLLQAFDGLRDPLTEQMETGSFDEEAALLEVEPVFDELQELLGDALEEADNYIPSATDLGVDIVASIFEIDVLQSLEHLSSVLSNPQQFDVEQELTDQLEVLGGFAELFTLPGFSEIIELTKNAIANEGNKALEITQVFLADCHQAREVILEGDRDKGGQPSAALIAISRGEGSESIEVEENTGIFQALEFGDFPSNTPFPEPNDPTQSLEDLFGGNVGEDNAFVAPEEFSEPPTESNSIDDLFGSPLTDNDFEPVEIVKDELNVFSELPDSSQQEEEIDSAIVFDWEELPEESSSAVEDIPSNSQFLEQLVGESALEAENLFAEIPEDVSNAFAEIESDIIELGSQIINSSLIDYSTDFQSDLSQEVTSTAEDITDFDSSEFEIENKAEVPITELDTDFIDSVVIDNKESQFSTPQNIDSALDSIGDIFEQLPPANIAEITEQKVNQENNNTTARSSTNNKERKKQKQAPIVNNLSVRVDLDRLDRMNNIIGELVINRNSLALQNEQLQVGVKDLNAKFSRFRGVAAKVREISDLVLIQSETVSVGEPKMSPNNRGLPDETNTFDSLEMDSYNHIHLLLQSILEEILQLEEGVEDIFLFAQQSDRTINSQRQMLGQMRDELMWARMLPLEEILKRFPRTLRDLSKQHKKPVNLNLIGTGVLVDKAVLEKLYDPLLHLLRNGFDHGIESPEIRRKQGKPEKGEIEIHAYYQGNQTIIEIRDDGKGLDIQKIIKKAISKDLITAQEAANAPQERIFDLIFEPGFSTAEKVSDISGRGVGMSVVREQIESLKGNISVNSVPNKGSTFTLALPLTLTIAKLLVVSLEQTAFALPSDSIEEIIIPLPKQIKVSGDRKFLYWNEQLVSIYNLQEILEYNCAIIPLDTNSKVFESVNAPSDWALPLLILRRGREFFALEVDRLITEQELVIKPFGKVLTAPSYTYGCTILGDGTLIPVLNGVSLINNLLGEETNPQTIEQASEITADIDSSQILQAEEIELEKPANNNRNKSTPSIQKYTVMVVDDSTALRRTMALSLEQQGYHILQAKDGRDAVEQLRKSSRVDLIVCDVEMPHMNGFEFLGVRRRDSALKKIPVIMLTSRSGEKHRNLATQLGANGYFTKPYVENEFLKALHKILENKESNTVQKNSKLASPTKKNSILIIDDSSALRKTMALSLESKGYRVLEARDGEEGIEQIYQNPHISLAICDIEMPNLNGFEFLGRRKKEARLQKIPVAMLTSRSQEKHQTLAKQLGADAYFVKPYVEDTFLQEISKLIKK